jgi:hypothetical protein
VNIHAIGDRANRASVDSFETVLGGECKGCNKERRLRIEHAQIIVRHPFIIFSNDLQTFERRGTDSEVAPQRPEAHQENGHNTKYSSESFNPDIALANTHSQHMQPLTWPTHFCVSDPTGSPTPLTGCPRFSPPGKILTAIEGRFSAQTSRSNRRIPFRGCTQLSPD